MQNLNLDYPNVLQEQIILNEMEEHDLKRIREWLFKRGIEEMRQK